ncbi:hypothetical protein ACCY16_17495 [Candidatus Pantoea formicae]|uniref:hypothetical protein n=1 Tax=Candidatus Pantoea formicae TaxID=2608355 RepID=UPI003ED91905
MSLPDIDLYGIRPHHGGKEDAFEELCCQLAHDEPIQERVRFDRKGRGGDTGVECFATLEDGSEVGWQVKFYRNFNSMIASLDESLSAALNKHPDMIRFIACFPFDLSDSRREGVKTALEAWNKWVDKWITLSRESGRTIAIERWDAHEIKLRLTESNARSAGRVAFWFDHELLTSVWFSRSFNRVADSLGDRYSPESHISLPIRRSILSILRDPAIFNELSTVAARIDEQIIRLTAVDECGAKKAAILTANALRQAGNESPEPFPLEFLLETIDKAAALTLAWRNEIDQRHRGQVKPHHELTEVSNLAGALHEAGRLLRSEHWQLINAKSLLIEGDAGSGKSHLLADACVYQLQHNRPALMILGGKLPDAEPWGEILRELDLPRHLQVRHFLGALNAAGEANRVRALIAIDALNEKNGQLIWPERLPALLNDLSEFPWIAVVLSCRLTYAEVVIPASLDARKLPRIFHEGFKDVDVIRYLAKRGISIQESPRQLDELKNPLFLRLACDSVSEEGAMMMPENFAGISDILSLYTTAVSKRIESSLNVAPKRKIVRKAIAVLAEEMARIGQGQLGFIQADTLMRTIHDGSEIAQDLLFQLENEGLLTIEPDAHSVPGETETVRFTFERVGDHEIAASLLERSFKGDVNTMCEAESPLFKALSDSQSTLKAGLHEALAVQLPEKFGIELQDLRGVPLSYLTEDAFIQSLLTRKLSAFNHRTWESVESMENDHVRYDTLIALASEPGHPFNVIFLDAELRALRMPERDACWSAHLAYSERAGHLIDWVWHADQSRLTYERAELAAMQLVWFLTATRRPLRDRATKALVLLLADRAELALILWSRFKDLDDGYVTERVMAALYGAALQGRWERKQLNDVALMAYNDLFSVDVSHVNERLRDHAIGLIAFAQLHAGDGDPISCVKLTRPFISPWPIEYVSDEKIDSYKRTYGNRGQGLDEIVNSCIDGDFGRYVLDPAVQDWSPASFGTPKLPSSQDLREEWYTQFEAVASKQMLDAYEALHEVSIPDAQDRRFLTNEKRALINDAKSHFHAVVGDEAFEEWRVKAEDWRSEGMYQRIVRSGPAGFNLAWARRWVIMRAHDLGWSEELHGEFDGNVRTSRNEHDLERIGKKYQWIALYELVARMRDNLAPLMPSDDDPYRLRNIDPSLLVTRTSDLGWDMRLNKAFWAGKPPAFTAGTPETAIAWIHSDDDIPDGTEVIAVTSTEDARNWLVLSGFETWSVTSTVIRTEVWRRVACMVVKASDLNQMLELLSDTLLISDNDLPGVMGDGYREHLGEYPWRRIQEDQTDWIRDWYFPGDGERIRCHLPILPTTTDYSAEAGGYDGSVSESINISMPAPWIMEVMGIQLKDGQSILYHDADNTLTFWDPSVSQPGRSAGLVDRTAFLEMLQIEGLVAIWAVGGEKNAYSEGYGEGFGGRVSFTRLHYSKGSEIVEMPRFKHFDEPSAEQLAEFRNDGSELSNEE